MLSRCCQDFGGAMVGRDGGRDNGGRFFLGVLEYWSIGVLESATVPSTPPIHIQ